MMTGAMTMAAVLAGCGGPQASSARQAADGAAAVAGSDSPTRVADPPPAAPRQGPTRGDMPVGGGMGAMHARMMGSSGEAPDVEAASASAAACPDITQPMADRGREVFSGAGNCFTCHGADGTGGPLAPDLTDGQWLNVDGSYGAIAGVVRTGVSQPQQYPAPMPPTGGGNLAEEQICAVAAYVYSLAH